ncbi:MAG: hypothetical protein WBL61_14845 [Bryobacteraceae bacterium]
MRTNSSGRGIPHEEVLAEFGLTMQDFPLKENGMGQVAPRPEG